MDNVKLDIIVMKGKVEALQATTTRVSVSKMKVKVPKPIAYTSVHDA